MSTKPSTTEEYEQCVQAMFFRWGAAGVLVLLLGFVAQGVVLTTQVQGLEPRMQVLETQLDRNSTQFDRLDDKVDQLRNDVTRIATRHELAGRP